MDNIIMMWWLTDRVLLVVINAPWMENVDDKGGSASLGKGIIWESSISSSQYRTKPKTALKHKVLLFKSKNYMGKFQG